MRARVSVDEQLLDAVHSLAAEADRRLDDVLDDALRLLLASVGTTRSIDLPTYGGSGLRPGVDLEDKDTLSPPLR